MKQNWLPRLSAPVKWVALFGIVVCLLMGITYLLCLVMESSEPPAVRRSAIKRPL